MNDVRIGKQILAKEFLTVQQCIDLNLKTLIGQSLIQDNMFDKNKYVKCTIIDVHDSSLGEVLKINFNEHGRFKHQFGFVLTKNTQLSDTMYEIGNKVAILDLDHSYPVFPSFAKLYGYEINNRTKLTNNETNTPIAYGKIVASGWHTSIKNETIFILSIDEPLNEFVMIDERGFTFDGRAVTEITVDSPNTNMECVLGQDSKDVSGFVTMSASSTFPVFTVSKDLVTAISTPGITNSSVYTFSHSTLWTEEQAAKHTIFVPKRLHNFHNQRGAILVDICRIQCISPLSDDKYSIILVSGVEIKSIDNKTTPIDDIVMHWKALTPHRIAKLAGWWIDLHRIQCITSGSFGHIDNVCYDDVYAVTLVSNWDLKTREVDHASKDIKMTWSAMFGEQYVGP